MATITAQMVKELREKTGVGMMDCKNALGENDGNLEAAVDWLRAKGLSKAAKKAGRIAAEGLIGASTADGCGTSTADGRGASTADGRGALVEVNSETDFVARNAEFQEMVSAIASLAIKAGGDVEALAAMTVPGKDESVADHIKTMIGTIGENMNLRRTAALGVNAGVVASYTHNAVAPGLGKIGVIVALASSGDKKKLAAFGKQIAMHIAATNPLAVSRDDLDPEIIERERAVLMEQARESGKPENIIEKMVEGRLRKYFEEVVLLAQTFVIDGESTVEKAIEAAAKDAGAPIEIKGFVRYALGEGLDKKDDDFAAEVAAAVSG